VVRPRPFPLIGKLKLEWLGGAREPFEEKSGADTDVAKPRLEEDDGIDKVFPV
jgi:hypothetical protein